MSKIDSGWTVASVVFGVRIVARWSIFKLCHPPHRMGQIFLRFSRFRICSLTSHNHLCYDGQEDRQSTYQGLTAHGTPKRSYGDIRSVAACCMLAGIVAVSSKNSSIFKSSLL